jgi:hypothetical protein
MIVALAMVHTEQSWFFWFSGGQPLKYLKSNGYPAFTVPLTGKPKIGKPLRSLRLR